MGSERLRTRNVYALGGRSVCGLSDRKVQAEAHQTIRGCEAKMARYRPVLDAGADIEEVTQWINDVKATGVKPGC
jgi:hypothetical protein